MKIVLRLLALLAALTGGAQAQTPPVFQSGKVTPTHGACWTTNGVIQDCGPPVPLPIPFPSGTLPVLSATAFGVKADAALISGSVSGTSNDVALGAALAACQLIGARLVLPPGNILLTGVQTNTITNCFMQGAGSPASYVTGNLAGGTTFYLTSTTTSPFIATHAVGMSGINFYHPLQLTGTTVYPPIIKDNGSVGVIGAIFDNLTFVNSYDIFAATPGVGWGTIKFSNITFQMSGDAFRLSSTGDGLVFSNLKTSAGPWLQITNQASGTFTALGAAYAQNTVFHILNSAGGAVNLTIASADLSARYGFKLDAGATVSESVIDAQWDGTGTIIDTSAGGMWANGNRFGGVNAGCSLPFNGSIQGNNPCFNLGSTGYLDLTNFHSAGSRGSFVVTAGASVRMIADESYNIGGAADGNEYYQLLVTGGTPVIIVQSSSFAGAACSNLPAGCAHVHGISTGSIVPNTIIIQNNQFQFFQDFITVQATGGPKTVITGNGSFGTNGTVGITIGSTGLVMYGDNWFDIPPVATPTSCGSGCVVAGSVRGTIAMGTGTITTATITLPFVPGPTIGLGGQVCIANVINSAQAAGCSVSGKVVTFNFSGNVAGEAVAYDALPPQ